MLVTLAEMKAYLGIAVDDLTYDTFLTNQITIVSEAVSGYCARIFPATDYVETFYRDAFDVTPKELTLYHFPLIEIEDGDIVEKCEDGGINEFELADVRINKPTATLTRKCRFFNYGDVVEVTYRAGYEVVPALVLSVVYEIVGQRYNKKKNGIDLDFGTDVQRISIPGTISIDFDYSLSSNERSSAYGNILGNYLNVLDPYRSERAVIGSVRLKYVG